MSGTPVFLFNREVIEMSEDNNSDFGSFDIRKLEIDNRFPYLVAKANLYLKLGPIKYREADYFSEPINMDSENIYLLEKGCNQIILGHGLLKQKPLYDLGVNGCSALFGLFHFRKFSRRSYYRSFYNGKKGVIDELTFRHIVDGSQIVYYNFCKYSTYDVSGI